MKRDVKEHPLGMSDRFRRVLAQKELQGNEFIQQLKRISKAGKVFVTTVHRVNLKLESLSVDDIGNELSIFKMAAALFKIEA
jgi:archaellum biogenesis ATPase FlaH